MFLEKINTNPFYFIKFRSFSFSSSLRIGSKTLSNCFKSGNVDEAEKLFDEIPKKNVVSWSILIHGYSINGFYKKSIESFSRMRISGTLPNSFTFVGLLVGLRNLQELELVKSIHGMIVTNGFESDSVVGTSLLDSYAKFGSLFDSCKLFDSMENPGLVSCNAMISGYIKNKLFEESIEFFNRLRCSGLVPNESTMSSVIRGCIGLEMKSVCESAHGLILKLGLFSDLSLNNALLDMYSCLVDLDAAFRVFDMMEDKDVISWTTMIRLLVDLEYTVDALSLFVEMRASEVNLDCVAITNLISACTVLGDSKRGRLIHAQAFVFGFVSEIPLANSLITMYSKCGKLDCARDVFRQMDRKTLVTWTAMISGYLQNGQPREALNLFMKVRLGEDYSLDSAIIINALTASGEIAALELCQQLHCLLSKAGFPRHRHVQNSLISAYSNSGNMDFAYCVFKQMGDLRDLVSWNSIIHGYGINGQGETAHVLYDEMRKTGETPDSATYSSILSACSHAGLINDGLLIFNEMMGDSNLTPAKEHYGCLIDLLARAGCLSEASGIVSRHSDIMGPNVLRSLLSGCLRHGNVELAEVVARKLFEQDPGESDQVVLLSNVYASVGRFADAEALRLRMQKQGLRKNPAISVSRESSYDFG